MASTHLCVCGAVKTPFLDIGGVNVVGEALDCFCFKSLEISQDVRQFDDSVHSPSSLRTLGGNALKRGKGIVTFPQCSELERFVKLVNVAHKRALHFTVGAQKTLQETKLKFFGNWSVCNNAHSKKILQLIYITF